MNRVMLVGRLTRDPELRSLPSGKPVANFVVATNEFRGSGVGERTEYHNVVAWDRLAEVCGQFLGKGQLVDVEGQQIDRLLPCTLEHVRRRAVRAVTRYAAQSPGLVERPSR